MKVWISKYALSTGIFEMEVESVSEDGEAVYGKELFQSFHGKGKEWHEFEEDAKRRAEEMRQKKISSLNKQIDKLQKMRF